MQPEAFVWAVLVQVVAPVIH